MDPIYSWSCVISEQIMILKSFIITHGGLFSFTQICSMGCSSHIYQSQRMMNDDKMKLEYTAQNNTNLEQPSQT